MNNFTNSISTGFNSFMGFLPTLLGAIALVVLAWIIAIAVRKGSQKGLKAVGFNRLLTKWGLTNTNEQAASTIDSISNVLYYLVWLIFIPGILSMLGLNAIASPITNMFDSVLSFIPNLFAAAVILAFGIFIGRFVKNLVYNLLITLNIDKWIAKMTSSEEVTDSATPSVSQKMTIAKVLANVVYIIILVPIITVALETLNIESISEPIIMVLNQVLAAIPNVIVAVILIGVGIVLAKFVGDLISGLLLGTGINKLNKYLKTPGSMMPSVDLAKVIGQIIQVVLVVFFVVEALNVLNLEVLNTIGTAVIAYLPLVLSALIILGIGLIGGTLLGNFITQTTGSRMSGNVIKYILIVMAVFMGLDQLKFATSIVNYAFLLILGGLSVAFALSFGIGGRDFAKRQLEKVETKVEKEQKE
ncbi:Conserved TM helix [Carnobacterium iners]|uniref:Conserved TM helix n=1 Tax=Carnobacterium iners TaxID=1073423 RepID=A0A1X7N7W1_9LACT|nr:mechanosensitive ion channel [Carnobacterium iners]SEL22930.1 Conserved TM helix [Carnobacterium iners]SMH33503.1 Conserved TM helix [Carnobacterium iners]